MVAQHLSNYFNDFKFDRKEAEHIAYIAPDDFEVEADIFSAVFAGFDSEEFC